MCASNAAPWCLDDDDDDGNDARSLSLFLFSFSSSFFVIFMCYRAGRPRACGREAAALDGGRVKILDVMGQILSDGAYTILISVLLLKR